MKPKVLMLLSGGLDSTILLYYLNQDYDVTAVTFLYGQKHKKEAKYAKYHTKKLNVNHLIINISKLKDLFDSALTSEEYQIQEGKYGEVDVIKSKLYVPHRNLLFLTLLDIIAYKHNINNIAIAIHKNDSQQYPDTTREFKELAEKVLSTSSNRNVSILTPFIELYKYQIVEIGYKLNVEMDKTWSCYKGGRYHCGRCPTCLERKEAFKKAGILDKTKYEV
ncbi:MAG: 7-cyano-7-deazaguanine synthase QueC [Candidatus Aenigmatarchaeota archaeon]